MPDDGQRERTQGLQELISTRRDSLVRIAARILGRGDEADDVVQDTIVAFLERFNADSPKDAWAYLARAVHLNALKRYQRRRKHVPLQEWGWRDWAASDLEEEPWAVRAINLEKAISDLPVAQQAVIRLKFYARLSYVEIGLALRISKNTAASRCRYALEAMRRTLTAPRGARKKKEV